VDLVRQARVPPIAAQNPEVQPELEQVVRKALARDLSARFQTAADLQDALAQVLFSQRLKVTSRDIEHLIASVLQEKQRSQPLAQKTVGSLIDALINEEILKFTSLEGINDPALAGPSPSPTASGNAPLDPGHFVDTRDWAEDLAPPTGRGRTNGRAAQRREPSGAIQTGLEDLLEGDGATAPLLPPMVSEAEVARRTGRRPSYDPPIYDDNSNPIEISGRPAKKHGGVLALVLLLLLVGAGAAAAYLYKPELLGLKASSTERR
jgi:hypothetical protein